MNKKIIEFSIAYSKATQETRDLIDSPTIGDFVVTLDKMSLKHSSYDLIAEFANYALGISTVEEIELALLPLGYSNIEAQQIISSVNTLFSLKKTIPTSNITPETVGYEVANEIAETEAALEFADTEAELEKISPIRTMVGDSKQVGYSSTTEPTYTSIQSAIINEKK